MRHATQLQSKIPSRLAEGFGRIKSQPLPALAAHQRALIKWPACNDATLLRSDAVAHGLLESAATAGNDSADDTMAQHSLPGRFALYALARAHQSRELARIITAMLRAAASMARPTRVPMNARAAWTLTIVNLAVVAGSVALAVQDDVRSKDSPPPQPAECVAAGPECRKYSTSGFEVPVPADMLMVDPIVTF